MTLLNVYLPTDYRNVESYDLFCMSRGQLACNIDLICSKTNYFGIIGDCNANSFGTSFFAELIEFCTENGLVLSDALFLGPTSSTYTYVSASHSTVSWLDHCMCSPSLHSCIQDIVVKYDVCVTDHIPILIQFGFQAVASIAHEPVRSTWPKLCWDTVTVQQVTSYNDSGES